MEIGKMTNKFEKLEAGLTTQVPVRMIVRLKSRYRGKLYYSGRELIIEKGNNMWAEMLKENRNKKKK